MCSLFDKYYLNNRKEITQIQRISMKSKTNYFFRTLNKLRCTLGECTRTTFISLSNSPLTFVLLLCLRDFCLLFFYTLIEPRCGQMINCTWQKWSEGYLLHIIEILIINYSSSILIIILNRTN